MEIPKFILDGSLLTLKQHLFIYQIPIFFVCNDKDNNYFLVYCNDIDEMEYSIVQVTCELLVKMFDNQMSMDEIFKSATKKWRAKVLDIAGTCAVRVDKFSEDDMPNKGAKYGQIDDCVKQFYEEIKKELSNHLFVKKFTSSFTQTTNRKHTLLKILIKNPESRKQDGNIVYQRIAQLTINYKISYSVEGIYA